MCVWMYVSMYMCLYEYVYISACVHVWLYVSMYVCVYLDIDIAPFKFFQEPLSVCLRPPEWY